MTREAEVESYLTARVRQHGGEVRKVKWLGRNGAPDRLVMFPTEQLTETLTIPGTHAFVELKRPGEKPRPNQLREHDRLRACGFTVLVIDSFEGVDALFA